MKINFSVCFKYPNERIKERMQRAFKNKAVPLTRSVQSKITLEEAKEAFKSGFEDGLDIILEPYL